MNPNSLGGGQQPTSSAPRRLLFAGGSAESKARSTRGSPGPHPGPERRGAPRHPRPLRFPGPEASGLPNHQPLGGPPIPGYSSGDTSRGALGRGELAFRAFPRRQGPRPEAPAAPGAGELEASSLPPGLASALLGPRDKVKKRLPRAPAESPRGAPGEACGGPKRLKAEPQAVEKWALGPMGDHPLNRCPAPLGWPRPGPKETPSAGPDARARPSQELLPCRDKGAPQDSASAPPPSFARGDLPGHR
ncbi:translation initiation factor IF-2-like [Monodelphis domestica]|uniref:translation initiation factor IF-2-like n=1 Tax=Monodelphis domestica TaxID=13616 RepID=UPI0024E19D02|nr:translation initiation factor IF-2-like [Monodelphis domestica]